MSDLFEKRADGSIRREVRSKKENKAKRKRKIITISVVVALALVFTASLFVNSNFIRRTLPAVSIGGVSFSAVEFDYFYNNAFQEYANWVEEQFGDMQDYYTGLLPSSDTPFSSQVYNYETGETWADFFYQRTVSNLTELVRYYNAAGAAGFEIPAEGLAQVNESIASIMSEAVTYSTLYPYQYPSPEGYLQAIFGSAINERSLRNIMLFVQKAISYGEHMRDTFTFTPEQLEYFYLDNQDSLDVFSFRAFLVEPDYIDREDFASDDAYDSANDEALAQASIRAQEIAEGIKTEEDFITAAREYDDLYYGDRESTLIAQLGEDLDPDFASWMMVGDPLQFGDMVTMDFPYGTAVVFFLARDNNSYQTTSMRQILILRDEVDPAGFEGGESDPDYVMLLLNVDQEASDRAQDAYDQFIAGGATEARFLELMALYSADSIEGGFYDRLATFMYEGQSAYALKVVDEIEQWLFYPGRAVGDHDLIRTEAYGYHIVYFMGHGERMRDIIATDRMRSGAFTEWGETLPDPGGAKKHWAFMFTLS